MSRNNKLIIVTLVFTFVFCAKANDDWLTRFKRIDRVAILTKVQLLKHNRNDVEKILGKPRVFPLSKRNLHETYVTKYGWITVSYTTSICSSLNEKEIPLDTVMSISISLDKFIKLSDVDLPLDTFEEIPEGDTPMIVYRDPKVGLYISVLDDEIQDVEFFPKNDLMFECED